AQLPVLRPEDEVELPLGIDHALRAVRNVLLKASSRGLFSKDDLTEVKVSVEIANPHPRPVPLSVIEQLPVAKGEKIEVEVLEVTPAAKRGDGGRLEWSVQLPARGRTVLAYRYRIVRPKGWELRQSAVEPRWSSSRWFSRRWFLRMRSSSIPTGRGSAARRPCLAPQRARCSSTVFLPRRTSVPSPRSPTAPRSRDSSSAGRPSPRR